MDIFIPSRGRYLPRYTTTGTVAGLPPCLHSRVYVVVNRDEYMWYARAYRDTDVRVLLCDANNIAEKRLWIGKYVQNGDKDKFMMIDDDVRFYKRANSDSVKLVPLETEDYIAMFNMVSHLLDTYPHVGISAREGNNRVGAGGPRELVRENTRTNRALAYRTHHYMKVKHCRLTVMEDFDINLQMLERGWKNANIFWYAQDQRQTNMDGGCSIYRTHEVHDQNARKLAELHPGLVKLRQKENKTGGEFGKRTEVTIYWKKAYKMGISAPRM